MFRNARFSTFAVPVLATALWVSGSVGAQVPCGWGSGGYSWAADFDGNGSADIASADGHFIHLRLSEPNRFRNQTGLVPGDWGGAEYTWAADFDGNGMADIASARGGDVFMHLSTGRAFLSQTWAVPGNWGSAGYTWVADFDGNGKADIASASGSNVFMSLSDGGGFDSQIWTVSGAWGSSDYTWVEDFDGNGKADIASASGGKVFLSLSNGSGFDSQTWTVAGAWGSSDYTWVGDFNGDGKTDIASANGDNAFISLSNGSGFDSQTWVVPGDWGSSAYTWVGDFNGDRRADIASARGFAVRLHLSLGDRFDSPVWRVPPVIDLIDIGGNWGGPDYTWVADFNGDGTSDLASANQCSIFMNFSTGDGFRSSTLYASPDRPDNEVLSLLLQPDGKLLLGGQFRSVGQQPRIGLARLNADGSLDTGFVPGLDGTAQALALQPDGKIVVGGWFSSVSGHPRRGIARLNPDGSLDAGFDAGLQARAWPDSNPRVNTIVVLPDGKLLIGGAFESVGGAPCIATLATLYDVANRTNPNCHDSAGLARLNPDGTLDAAFDSITFNVPRQVSESNLDIARQVAPEPTTIVSIAEGRFLVGTLNWEADTSIQRRTASGGSLFLLDRDFDRRRQLAASGLLHPSQWGSATISDEAVRSFSRFLQSAAVDSPIRFLTEGTWVTTMALQPDGGFLIGGAFESVSRQSRIGIARLQPDATLDPGFDAKLDSRVNAIAVQSDGRILVGGTFRSVGGQPDTEGGRDARSPRLGIARLNSDGSLDLNFHPQLNGPVNAILIRADGKILLAGGFTSVDGMPTYRIALLNPDGSLDPDF